MNRVYLFLVCFCVATSAIVSFGYFSNREFFQKTEEPLENTQEPVITLTGKLRLKLFPGPPEYSSIEAGDRPDLCWVVELDGPSCLLALNVPDNQLSLDLSDILKRKDAHLLTLCLDEDLESLCQEYKDQDVIVRGNLFHAHTAHHYTSLLMSLKQMGRYDL